VYFDISGTFRNSNWPKIFLAFLFSPKKQLEKKKYESGPPWSTGGICPSVGRATHARLALVPQMSFVFALDWSAWPKKSYIKTPHKAFSKGVGRETRKHETEAVPVKIGGGTQPELPQSLLQTLQHHKHRHHDDEGVVHLWTMGLWQYLVLSLSLSLVLWCLDAIWSARHDYGHII
jgi:hypothetical protein